ncbi:MAG: hypothetical protein EZS28_033993 [Streblomastix strix]|uniref:Uncharacterized protein n=1 Tax=Streblomastix strix TaxID=222440 RepID=A0A5J4UKA3_9EUKA|nr:MAG: hypothetical protein EZS28_033993 [Streblomastix strix]
MKFQYGRLISSPATWNQIFQCGQRVSIEVDMNSVPRKAVLFIDGIQQKNYVTGIPDKIRFFDRPFISQDLKDSVRPQLALILTLLHGNGEKIGKGIDVKKTGYEDDDEEEKQIRQMQQNSIDQVLKQLQ